MSSKYIALAWEVWRLRRAEFAFKLAFLILVTLWMSFQITSVKGPEREAIAGVTIFMLIGVSLLDGAWIQELSVVRGTYSFRHWNVRPVPTWAIALIPMTLQVLLAVTCYVLLAWLLNLWFFEQVPIIEPILGIAVGNLCLTSAAKGPSTQWAKLIAVCVVAAGLIAGLALCSYLGGTEEHLLMAVGRRSFPGFSIFSNGVLACIGAVAIFFSIRATAIQRCGDTWHMSRSLRNRRLRENRPVPAAFDSQFQAQFWLQYRKCAPVMHRFAISLALVSIGFCVVLHWMVPSETAAAQWLLFGLVAWPVVCQVVGSERLLKLTGARGNFAYDAFEGKMAVRSDVLVWMKIFVLGVLSLGCWLLMWGVVAVGFWWVDGAILQEKLAVAVLKDVHVSIWLIGLTSWVVSYFASAAVLIAGQLWISRNNAPFLAAMVVAYGLGILAFVDASQGWKFAACWEVLLYLLAAMVAALSLWSIIAPVLHGATGVRPFILFALGWVLVAFPFWFGTYQVPEVWTQIPLAAKVLLASMTLVPLAGPVLAPLAMQQFRHA